MLDNGNWRAAENLKVGDRIVTSNGEIKTVDWAQEKHYNEARRIFNLNVDEFHTYFVGSDELLVHNDCYVYGGIKASSVVLRNNMIKAGIEVPNYLNAAHHIIAGTDRRAVELRNILQRYGIDINSAENGVFLPTVRDVSYSAYHRSLHTNLYYKNVEKLFQNVGSKEDAIQALQKIREQLIKGTFSH